MFFFYKDFTFERASRSEDFMDFDEDQAFT